MKKSTLAALLMSGLLAGCSDSSSTGSSSNTSVSKTYQWQMVHLESVDENDDEDEFKNGCIIYADSSEQTDESTVDDPEYKVITAFEADEKYNIIYHNEDGSIYDIFAANETNDGVWTIELDDVPDNGYVSLEETESVTGGQTGSYMFSVKKALLDDMVLNIRNSETKAACVKGDDYRENDEKEMFVNVTQLEDDINFYQSSYDVTSIDGKTAPGAIPVDYIENENRDVLITTFGGEYTTSNEKTDLQQWVFIDSSFLYETKKDSDGNDVIDEDGDIQYIGDAVLDSKPLNDDSLTAIDVAWDFSGDGFATSSINLDTENTVSDINEGISGVIALHDDTTYFWQPIYDESTDLNVAYDSDDVDVWNSYFSGNITLVDNVSNNDVWEFNSFNFLTDYNDFIYLMDFDTAILDSLENSIDTVISSSCTSILDDDGTVTTPDFCVDLNSSFDSNQFTYQRLHLRIEDTSGDNISYQTIYSEVNNEPVVLESSEVTFNTSSAPNLVRIELNLMKTDDEALDAVQYLMSQNIDDDVLANESSTNIEYNDLNGFITTETEDEALYQAVLKTNTTIVQSVYETP